MNEVNAIVEVAIRLPLPLLAIRAELERLIAPVPPLLTPSVPVICDVRLIVPESVEKLIQLFAMAKQPDAMFQPPVVPTKDDVAAVKLAMLFIENIEPGEDVAPTPTLP